MRFVETLLQAPVPVIEELKPRSADGTELIGARSAAELVDAYTEAGIRCLSVVTGRWFGGTVDLLAEVAARTESPVLS